MKYIFLISIVLACSSCKYFETERISEEHFYDEEVKTINWDLVDVYPEFVACSTITEPAENKACFEEELAIHVGNSIMSRTMKSVQILNDTVWVDFKISETAAIEITNITVDSIVKSEFPKMEDWIIEGIDSVKLEAPAYKRGVPVETQFRLPIIVTTE